MGVPVQAFVDTVTKYNSYVEQGFDPDFGKRALEAKTRLAALLCGQSQARRPPYHGRGGNQQQNPSH